MTDIFSVNTIFFNFLGYPLSYIEFVGTILYLWSVWLIAKRNILTWPVGILSVVLYLMLFYQIRLYSDMGEQIYYVGASAYGWWYWSRARLKKQVITDVFYGSKRIVIECVAAILVFSAILGTFMSHIHELAPVLFPEPASFPYIDALTTVMSLFAMWLMARKHIESWLYWIIVDVIGIWLYFIKDVKFISLLYVLLLILAIRGFNNWNKARTQLDVASPLGQVPA